MLRVEKVNEIDRFRRLEPVWNSLLNASSSRSITLTWEWISTWWDVFGEDRRLNVLVAWDKDEIVGIAPLLERTVHHYGMLPFRRLEFLASGEDEADEICSENLDFIIRRGREAEAVAAFLDYLGSDEQSWDELILKNLAASSPNLAHMTGASCAGFEPIHVIERRVRAFLPLPSEHSDFVKTLPGRLRGEIRRDRKIAKWRGAELRVVERPDDFDAHFDTLINLHQARWNSRGRAGAFASDRFTRFHRGLGPILIDRGLLKIFALLVDEQPVSAQMLFIEDDRISIYQSGFNIGDSGIISPGTLLIDLAIEWAIANGFSTWDFLKASAGSYKFRWSPSTSDIYDVRLATPSSKEMIYVTANKMIDGLRQIRRALR